MKNFFVATINLPIKEWLAHEEDLNNSLSANPDHQVSVGIKPIGDNFLIEVIFRDSDQKLLPAILLSQSTIAPLIEKNWLAEQRRDFVPITIVASKPNQQHRWWIADSDYRDGASPPPYPTKKLLVDISLAFGTGRHPTTQLCLDLLTLLPIKKLSQKKWRVLDVGTGTGILAMAAKSLCRRAVLTMTDNDPVAIKIAKTNAHRNRVAVKKFIVGDGLKKNYKPSRAALGYDLIFANIVFTPLWHLATAMGRASKNHGFVILSGITAGQENNLRRRYENAGFLLVARRQRDDWVGLLLQKRQQVNILA